jgi:hypothetical protein
MRICSVLRNPSFHANNGCLRSLTAPPLTRQPWPGDLLRRRRTLRASIIFTSLALCCSLAPALHAQGFGRFEKSKITLHRKLPPVIHFTGSTFNIKTTARDQKYAEIAASLKDLLETELLKD